MKKLTTFLLMVLISTVGALAQTITTSGDVDFGTYSIKGKEYVEPDAGIGIDVTISDKFFDYEGDIMGEIVDDEAGVFYLEGSSYGIATVHIQPKYGNYTGTFTLNFYAIEKGTYTARAHFWGYGAPSYDQVDAYANLKLVVTDQAIIPELLTFEKVTSTSQLAAGDIVVFASESTPAVNADLSSTALPFYTDGVTFNSENNTIQTPKGITTFTLSKYSGNWQFTKTGTSKRLTMLVDNSGSKEVVAFGYDGDSDQGYYYTWNISFDSKGNATVARAGNTDYYVMINNMPSLGGDVFKPYNSNKNVYTLPQLYKQKSESAAESKITFSPSSIDFGSVELNETKSIEVTYTAEFLTEIPDFDISGTDKALFTVTADAANSLTSGKVTVTYAGKGTTTGAKSAGLYYLTQDINIELMDGTLPIAITLTGSTVHPTAIAIEQTSPQELEVGSTLQLSVAFTPTNTDAANKGITWTSNKPTIASVDENGLVKALTYDQYNNEVTITATSTDNEELQSTIVVKVIQVKPTSIVLDKDELIVGLGKTVELWATVKPDGASQSVKFWIDDTSIATRTNESKYENGAYKYYAKVTGKKLGETTIRAYSTADETVDKTIAVKVVDVVAESISFEQSEINVALGGTTTLAPTFTPSDVTDKSLTFSGYDATIVSVNAEGVVTALKEGTTTITATTSNGKSAQVTITVTGQIWYTLVTNPDLLLAGDQIIFARLNGETKYVINGWHSNKNSLTAETANAEFSADKVSCDNAMIFTISETTGGYKLTNNGATLGQNKTGKAELVTNKNDVWTISSDANGVFFLNTLDGNRSLRYNTGTSYARLYSTGQVQLYVYTLTPHTSTTVVTPDKTSVDFGEVEIGSKAGTQSVTFTTDNLSNNIQLSLDGTDKGLFGINQTEIDKAGGSVSITFSTPTAAGDYSASLVYTYVDANSQTQEGTVTITAKVVAPYSSLSFDKDAITFDPVLETGETLTRTADLVVTAKNLNPATVQYGWADGNASVFNYALGAVDNVSGVLTITFSYSVVAAGNYTANFYVKATGIDGQEYDVKIPVSLVVNAKQWFTQIYDPSSLQEGDKIVFAREESELKFVAGAFNKDKLGVEKTDVEFADGKVTSEKAQVFELVKSGDGFRLMFNGTPLSVSTTDAKLYNNSENNTVWTFDFDGNGVYALNPAVAKKALRYNTTADMIRYYGEESYAKNVYVYTLTPHASLTLVSPTPKELDFGSVELNGSKVTKTVAFKTANLPSSIALSLAGDDAALFALDKSSITKDGGEVNITFSPTTAGTFSATLLYSYTDDMGAAKSGSVSLSGKAVDADCDLYASINLINFLDITETGSEQTAASDEFSIIYKNTSEPTLSWAEGSASIFSYTIVSTSADEITLTVNYAVVSAGNYKGTLHVEALGLDNNKYTADIPVMLVVDALPEQQWFTLVHNATSLQDGDVVVLARNIGDDKFIGSEYQDQRIIINKSNVEFDGEKVSSEKALIFYVEQVSGGFTLTFNEDVKLGVTAADKANLNGANNTVWNFVSDENGVYLKNTISDERAVCYNGSSSGGFIRFYKPSSTYRPMYIYTLNPHETPSATDNVSISDVTYNGSELLNPTGKLLQVYNANGMLVCVSNSNINFSGFAAGVYMVRCAGETMKVIR